MSYASHTVRQRQIDWVLNPSLIDLDGTWFPDRDDFESAWEQLNDLQKRIVANCISATTYGEVMDALTITAYKLSHTLKNGKKVVRALIYARLIQLPSDVARTLYIETLMANEKSREYHYSDIERVVKSDREHLKELAGKLDMTGDGKRGVLKELVAYGMQAKQVEAAILDEETGETTAPAVIALADPKMVFQAIQELNKMDHEYGQDDKATSSIESQADRIRRLAKSNKSTLELINKASHKQAKVLNSVVKDVTEREIKTFTHGSKNPNAYT